MGAPEVLLSLLIPALTALTWLAYCRPEAYRGLGVLLVGAGFAYLVGVMIWGNAMQSTLNAVRPFVTDYAAADAAVRTAIMPTRLVGLWIPIGTVFYLLFLGTFPLWLVRIKRDWAGLSDKEKP